MNKTRASKKLGLNLASRPLRNRRLYHLLLGILALGLVFILVLGSVVFIRYSSRAKSIRESAAETERLMSVVQREEKNHAARIAEAVKKYKDKVDLVNTVILRKSFSWDGFLSHLEEALPGPNYITSLSPSVSGETKIELRFKVVSPGLNELLELIENLNSLGFQNIRVMNEVQNERGQLLSEISMSYERSL